MDGGRANRFLAGGAEISRRGGGHSAAPVHTKACLLYTSLALADQLHDAVKNIRGTYQAAQLPELGEGGQIDTSIPADPNVKNYSYTVVGCEVYYRENSRMVKP